IIAQAGKFQAVTIATNMAGRGTDIMLGGNPEFLAKNEMIKQGCDDEALNRATSFFETDDEETLSLRRTFKELLAKYKDEISDNTKKVIEAGGLFIIGTERHESRRIDNQLRGRAGRQGDPGASRFYLSLDDDLMRLFGGEKLTYIMETLKVSEDMPIENRLLTGLIENCQKRVEGRNFSIRKNTLNYDDVMNKQRETIYSQRDMVLKGENIREKILDMIDESIAGNVNLFLGDTDDNADWNLAGLRDHYLGWITTDKSLRYSPDEQKKLTKSDVCNALTDIAHKNYEEKEARLGEDMRRLERLVLLRVVDTKWMDHIDNMDELRKSIHLRSYAQKNPVVEYRIEGYNMFDEMVEAIREDTARLMLTAELRIVTNTARDVAKSAAASGGSNDGSEAQKPKKIGGKIGRNDPCPCGSGKKYKKCCGKNEQ
ncbi:MAG: SEC-C metal-binding domain-containing protein, partial [Oscillospiraceae bacterium]